MQTRLGRRPAVGLALLLLVACGSGEEPVATRADGADRPAPEHELDRAAIAAREEAWLDARPAAYAFEVETTCDCFLAGTYSVTVDGEEVVGVVSREPDAEPYRIYSPPTLDGAFAMLDEALALAESGEISDGRASASFDPSFGYPVSWTVTGSDGLPSYHVEVRDFTPLDPAVIDRSPAGLALTISNQSFDDPDVGLTVVVDGEVVVDRSFPVENQHTNISYHLPLEPGDHELTVRADTGATHERTVTLGSEGRYLYVGYWGGDPLSPEVFSVSESDQPFGFG